MMTAVNVLSFVGQLATAAGLYQHTDRLGQPHPGCLPAAGYRSTQPAVPILVAHDPDLVLGHLEYLERDAGGLWAAGRIQRGDLLDPDTQYELSPMFRATVLDAVTSTDAHLIEVSLVRRSASLAIDPVRWLDGDLVRLRGAWPHRWPLTTQARMTRAATHLEHHPHTRSPTPSPVVIHDLTPTAPPSTHPTSPLRRRAGGEVLAVDGRAVR